MPSVSGMGGSPVSGAIEEGIVVSGRLGVLEMVMASLSSFCVAARLHQVLALAVLKSYSFFEYSIAETILRSCWLTVSAMGAWVLLAQHSGPDFDGPHTPNGQEHSA